MRETTIYRGEVHVAGICFHRGKVLVVKRSPVREIYPNLWECGGGQVEEGENFEDAVQRQLREELGVIVQPVRILKTYHILTSSPEQAKIPGIKFICKIVDFVDGNEPKISSEHTEWRWQSLDKLEELPFIPGVREDIEEAFKLYQE